MRRAGAYFEVERLLQEAPVDAQKAENLRMRSWNVTKVVAPLPTYLVVAAEIAEYAIRFQRLLQVQGDKATVDLFQLFERVPLGRQLACTIRPHAARSGKKRHRRLRERPPRLRYTPCNLRSQYSKYRASGSAGAPAASAWSIDAPRR